MEVTGTKYIEYAWMENETTAKEEQGASGNGKKTAEKNREWRPLKEPKGQAPEKEERLSMFPKNYEPSTRVEAMKGPRRLWAGLIPVAKRDTYEAAPVRRVPVSPDVNPSGEEEAGDSESRPLPPDDSLADPRMTRFDMQILGAFRQVRKQLRKKNSTVQASEVRDPLVFAWYDFWQFLGTHLPAVRSKVKSGVSPGEATFGDDTEEEAGNKKPLLRVLDGLDVGEMGLGSRAYDALRTFSDAENARHAQSGSFEDVLRAEVLLHDGDFNREELASSIDRLFWTEVNGVEGRTIDPDGNKKEPTLKTAVGRALGSVEKANSLSDAPQPPMTDPVEGGAYVVRCLYERPNCPEPLRMQISEQSRPFRLASFFDSEAPARDINITMPGVSLQELRNSSQSATMVFTTELSNQATKIQEVVFEELGANGDAQTIDLGRVCSLSIPIITICALVLLLIIVVLLNIVFWWLPFFKICFPLPSSDS